MMQFAGLLLSACVLLGAVTAGAASGHTWHVAPQSLPGVDRNVQFRTISEAVARVAPGDTVLIHGGTYREQVVVEKSGTAEQPIRLVAASGEHVVVTGADDLTGWEQVDPTRHIYRTAWPHVFISWNETRTHPDDEYHAMIGRAEQVIVNNYLLHQVLSRDQLSRGSFYVDEKAKQLYVWGAADEELPKQEPVEASVRDVIWRFKGSYLQVRGLRFRYAANHAQQGAGEFFGDHNLIEDCVFERTNGNGASFGGEGIVVRRCTFQDNGQLGFGAGRAHGLLFTDCTVRGNNTKGFDRQWEAGACKITLSRGAVFDHCSFLENRGSGIWFDIGNEDCTVRNCLIADNDEAGIFYEISYGLRAYDNVITGNGFGRTPGAWGTQAGIALSSSPNCIIERNLLVSNKEGFAFREQERTTPRISGERRQGERREEEAVWNHDETIRNNVLAYNRDAQVWGWFDVGDQRHWPAAMHDAATKEATEDKRQPTGLTLEKLGLTFTGNNYYAAAGQGLVNWGVAWGKNRRYAGLDELRTELRLDTGGVVGDPGFADMTAGDFRVPAGSPLLRDGCYPRGEVPGVKLGIATR